MLLHEAQHLLHALGRDLLLLRHLDAAAFFALRAQQPQHRGQAVACLVLVVRRFIRHGLPGVLQAGKGLALPGGAAVQQEKRRGPGLQQRADALLPEDGVHAAHKARVEHPGVQQRVPALGLFHRVEHPGVDKDALPGPQNELRLVHVHGQRAFHRKDELELLMPVPGHRVAFDVLRVAGNGEQCAAVLHQLPAFAVCHDVRRAVDAPRRSAAGLECHGLSPLSAKFRQFQKAGFVA